MASDPSYPLVSIIIPTYNRAGYLREALASVVAQTYPSLEIIVVDDGSSDDTAAVVKEFDRPVCFIRQQNQGVATARNRGFQESHGQFVGFLDDDDTYSPQKIALQVKKLTAQPALGFVHTRYTTTDPQGNVYERAGLLPDRNHLPAFLSGNYIWMSSPLIRRTVLEEVGGFDAALSTAADYDLWLRILDRGYDLGCVQQILGAYRIHPTSMVTKIDLLEQEVISILDRFYSRESLSQTLVQAKAEAYAQWRIWLCTRYYGTGGFEHARRNLLEAARLLPSLADLDWLIYYFAGNSVDPRVADPFQYMQDLFANLPEEFKGLQAKQNLMLSYIHLVQGLRAYAAGQLELARQAVIRAVEADPELPQKPKLFSFVLCGLAMSQPVDQLDYLSTVFSNLPECARALASARSQVFGRIQIGLSFEDFHCEHYRQALGRAVPQIFRSPSWLFNRGVQSLLVKSSLGLLRSARN